MSNQPFDIAGVTHSMQRLRNAYEFGQCAEHPGLIDTTAAAAHHMGGMLDQMRALRQDCVAELRERNLAAAASENTGSCT